MAVHSIWFIILPPQKVLLLFPPPFLWKSEMSMFRPLCEVGGGVDDLHCCATHSRGVLKPGNSWSQQSVHHFIHVKMSSWTAAEIQEMQRLLVSGAVFVVRLLLDQQARNGRYFQINMTKSLQKKDVVEVCAVSIQTTALYTFSQWADGEEDAGWNSRLMAGFHRRSTSGESEWFQPVRGITEHFTADQCEAASCPFSCTSGWVIPQFCSPSECFCTEDLSSPPSACTKSHLCGSWMQTFRK